MNFLKHSVDCALENQWHSRHVELPCQANCRCYCNIAMMFTLLLASQFTGEQILMWNNENTLLLFFFSIGHRKRVCADTDQRSHHAT